MTAPDFDDFVRRLGLAYTPSDQQRAIITAPADRAALVIAGAGAGKTETMSLRAAWLVASGVPASEILGLTFTRKAAGELAERMRMFTDRVRADSPDGDDGEDFVDIELPIVSTYNAWAAGVYRDHALAIGREPDAEVIGAAAAWRLARRIVAEHGGAELIRLQRSAGQIASTVVALSNAIVDHLADPSELIEYAARFRDVVGGLPAGGTGAYAAVDGHLEAVGAIELLVPLVEHYRAAKRRRGLIEFSDQVSAAVEICRARPDVVAELRARHTHVILDEYQDTSVVQTRLLATVFHGSDVMAVGDPNQSIYGWRGASAANLAEFAGAFGGRAEPFVLSVSQRNPARVLAAANVISQPLRDASPILVPELEPKPSAPVGDFDVRILETVDDEAAAVADWLAERIERDGEPPTAAIILRARKHMPRFQRALSERGVRSHILGGGGLLVTPEVTDLVATLRVLVDPDAGSALIRVLSGARWRIGLRDLLELERLARWLADRDHAQRRLGDDVRERMRASVLVAESSSIVEALDFIVDARPDHGALAALSRPGLDRLRRAGSELRRLRYKLALPLPDLVRHVEEAMRLDIEVAANDTRWGGAANLRAFRQQVEAFARVDDTATLRSLLDWLDRVGDDDREIALEDAPREPGVVQLVTIHGAKGLEWDIVALPRLVADEMPDEPAVGAGWVGFGRLPAPLRGDRDHLPRFDWEGADSRVDYLARLESYRTELKAAHREEYRRLMYVAVTRTRRDLLLSGSWWGGQRTSRAPSEYLVELADAGILPAALPVAAEHESDPRPPDAELVPWPRDPLGTRRPRVEAAAALVDRVATHPDLEALVAGAPWADDLALLIAEHEAGAAAAAPELPTRIPASGLARWIEDARGALDRMRRPMPEEPRRPSRIGTIFHAWVEHRYRTRMPAPLFQGVRWEDGDDVPIGGLDAQASRLLERCQEHFLATAWAWLRPIEVECAIELPFAGRIVPCKIDAVFEVDGRFEVVDWKTGRRPATAEDAAAFDVQLELYRIAWSEHSGTPLEQIGARAVFLAADDPALREYEPATLRDRTELEAAWYAMLERDVAG